MCTPTRKNRILPPSRSHNEGIAWLASFRLLLRLFQNEQKVGASAWRIEVDCEPDGTETIIHCMLASGRGKGALSCPSIRLHGQGSSRAALSTRGPGEGSFTERTSH